jgi:Bacillithiol biosynthesis BshC
LARLTERLRRTLAQRDQVHVERLERVLARLVPDGEPQERVLSWPWVAARAGSSRFVDALLAAVVPFDGALRELRP